MEKKNKSSVLQWIVLFAVPMIVVSSKYGSVPMETLLPASSIPFPSLSQNTTPEASAQSATTLIRVDRGAGSFMVLYYPVEKFDSLLSEADLAAGAFLALVDSEGLLTVSSSLASSFAYLPAE